MCVQNAGENDKALLRLIMKRSWEAEVKIEIEKIYLLFIIFVEADDIATSKDFECFIRV